MSHKDVLVVRGVCHSDGLWDEGVSLETCLGSAGPYVFPGMAGIC